MDNKTTEQSLWGLLEGITENLKYKRLADVFRFVSFQPFETFGPHQHSVSYTHLTLPTKLEV